MNNGLYACIDDAHKKQCLNGTWNPSIVECGKGCSLGQCVEDVFVQPNRLVLKKNSTYSLVVPVRTGCLRAWHLELWF